VIPGHEVSGTVVALGYGTTGFGVGGEVFGLTDWYRDGSLAEFVAVEARNLATKPGSLSHVDAAAFPMTALTAWQALFVHADLKAGQTVVIHGAGGGVGTLARPACRQRGCPGDRDRQGRSARPGPTPGAEQYLDLAHDALDEVKGVDVVFDLIGGDVLHRSWPILRPGGSIVSIVEAPNAERADVNCLLFVVEPNGEQLTELARRIDTERLRAVVGNVGALSDGPAIGRKRSRVAYLARSCSPHRALSWGEVIGCEMAADRPSKVRPSPARQENRNRHQPARCPNRAPVSTPDSCPPSKCR